MEKIKIRSGKKVTAPDGTKARTSRCTDQQVLPVTSLKPPKYLSFSFVILTFLGIFIYIFFISLVVADVISVNSGGGNDTIITPGGFVEEFFSQANRIPIVSNVLLTSTSGNNFTFDNLTVTFTSSDADLDFISNITDWRLSGTSTSVLNMPFDKNVAELTSGAVRDYSTYGNNGTLGGGTSSARPTWNSSCKVGGCYSFDGTGDYLKVNDPASGSLDFGTGNFSVSGWFYLNSLPNDWKGIAVKGASGSPGYSISISSGNSFSADVMGSSGTNQHVNCANSAVLADQWYHGVAVFDRNDKIYVYLNGDEKCNAVYDLGNDNSVSNSIDLYLGSYSDGSQWFFNGSIDEIQIYNRALSPEQVSAIYDAGVAGHQVEKVVSQETAKGDSWQVAITPNDRIMDGATVLSNVLSIDDSVPEDPTDVTLVSLNGRNESDTNLNCSAFISDFDNSLLDVSLNWFKNNTSVLNQTFEDINNATTFSTLLNSGNLTLGDIWKCSVRTYDGDSYSSWVNSNNLTIVDITSPNITIISPNSSINYTTLEVDFNISVVENENVSMCFYSLDSDSNVTMTEVNDSYFWFEPSLGPGPHFLEYYCNDTSNNLGYNSTNFTILNSAGISILLSDELETGVKWNVVSLPVDDLDAIGNNATGLTYYYINISATNVLVDIYVRANGDLYTDALDVLGLGNETYSVNTTDPTVSNSEVFNMTTNYTLIGGSLEDGSAIYMKFYLDAPSTQPAGIYLNQLQFKAVREGEEP
ncbi:MAG: LamG domain-containing protein [Nanoarchaeota archaeon]|nr:LamG domain-containing protein [Nanoarchaeota archaeon]